MKTTTPTLPPPVVPVRPIGPLRCVYTIYKDRIVLRFYRGKILVPVPDSITQGGAAAAIESQKLGGVSLGEFSAVIDRRREKKS